MLGDNMAMPYINKKNYAVWENCYNNKSRFARNDYFFSFYIITEKVPEQF